MNKPWMLAAVLALAGGSAWADAFGNGMGDEPTWADTPKGRFECQSGLSVGNRQVLKLAGKVIYQQPRGGDPIQEGATLRSGIVDEDSGCPFFIANRDGYLVIVRALQPPHYGINGYAVVDFNRAEPSFVTLGAGQNPKNDTIAKDQRITWRKDGLTLHYVGYALDVWPDGSAGQKVARRATNYVFKTGEASQAGSK